jgi:snapalysin
MLSRKIGMIVGITMTMLAVVAAPASAESQVAQKRITISGGGEYASYLPKAIKIWNEAVPNIRTKTSGHGAIHINVINSGGSNATIGHGSGTINISKEDVNKGNYILRIMTHEMGHTLGLRDNYNKDGKILMSGGSAGTSCRNTHPSQREADRVNRSFSNGRLPNVPGNEGATELAH